MLKLSKKVEYGLIAIRHIASVNNQISTVKEISEKYSIPSDVLAKVMQKLTKGKLITSHQGAMGGYTLARGADQISVMNVISVIEGSQMGIAQCFSEEPENCSIYLNCTIKNPLGKIQHNLELVFNSMKVSEIV
ncbi:MAG: Rrf2 family transcriptional regulator [Bacteriovoracaceae bacterium]|nr:Rrf2 family transcriptional regulator [Bacteroidota bacterium]